MKYYHPAYSLTFQYMVHLSTAKQTYTSPDNHITIT